MKLGLKEYLAAVEHWFDMYEAWCLFEQGVYDKWVQRDYQKRIDFYNDKWLLCNIKFDSDNCPYCIKIKKIFKQIHCDCCLLKDIECDSGYSPWKKFVYDPTKQNALNMLLAIIERKPDDYKETDSYFE